MNRKQPYRTPLRFRRWSRKAYAAFASLGQCVTIGYLPKSVADSSLKKQKAGSAAGCKSGGRSFVEENDGNSQETDIGLSPGCGNGLGTVLEIFGFGTPQAMFCPVNAGEEKENSILKNSGTWMTRTMQGLYAGFATSASSTFFIPYIYSVRI